MKVNFTCRLRAKIVSVKSEPCASASSENSGTGSASSRIETFATPVQSVRAVVLGELVLDTVQRESAVSDSIAGTADQRAKAGLISVGLQMELGSTLTIIGARSVLPQKMLV